MQLGEYVALKYSDFIKISSDLKVKDLKNFKKEKLSKGEILYVSPPGVVMSLYDYKNVKATITNKNYTIKNTLKTPILGSSIPLCLILNDEDYNLLRPTSKVYEFNGIKINNTDNIKLLEKELITIKPIKNSLHVNVSKDKSFYSVFGIVYFLGAFLSLVFIIATGSIIYFKLISEAYLDKDKYVLLKRLGMTNKEIFRATTRQIGISYLLPLVVGIIHSCVAMSVLSKLIDYNIIMPAISSIITFIVVYVGYFIATTRKYMKIVM